MNVIKLLTNRTVILVLFSILLVSCGNQGSIKVSSEDGLNVELKTLVAIVRTALAEAQTTNFAPNGLTISSAKLSLTVKDKIKKEGGISLIFISAGASSSNSETHNFDITFDVPSSAPVAGLDRESIDSFLELMNTVAEDLEFSGNRDADGLFPIKKLSASLSFSIEQDINGKIGLSVGPVEMKPGLSKSYSSTQKVVLEITRDL